MKIFFRLLLLCFFAMALSCSDTTIAHGTGPSQGGQGGQGDEAGDADGPPPGERGSDAIDEFEGYEPFPWVHILSPEAFNAIVDVTETSLTFERGLGELEEIEVQDVIFHAHEAGLLIRRVLEIDDGGDDILVMFTEDGNIDDVMRETGGEE